MQDTAPLVGGSINIDQEVALALQSGEFETEFDEHYGIIDPEQIVVIRPYSDDSDDRVLAELRPRFIVMYEPNQDFIRRIEVIYSTG